MKTRSMIAVLFLLMMFASGFAQDQADTQGNPPFTQQELDQMLAPVALYPDALLSQLLMAATYPLEIVEAARWSRDHGNPTGDAAVQLAGDQGWDPSVVSLLAFPDVLQTMDDRIDWTERLGDAFLAQQAQVMDTVQALRRRAQSAGNLQSNQQVDVEQQEDDIEIGYASPDLVYVPYYDPRLVFGPWWWPDYPPVFWGPWPDYAWTGGFAWGLGIGIGADFFFGGWDWPNHHLYIHDHRHWFPRPLPGTPVQPWRHDPQHRHAVPYRNIDLNRMFRPVPRPPAGYNGHEYAPASPPRSAAPPPLPTRPAPVQPSPPSHGHTIAPPIFEDVGHGPEARDFSARGRASMPAPIPRPAPPRSNPPPGHRH